jgi:putative transposase
MKNRGMSDILIACTDNLTGMSEAISAVHPKCEHQLCIVHQIRNSLKYVSYKDRKELVADLKLIYQASTEDAAHLALEAFDTKWSSSIYKLLNPGTVIGKIWYYFCNIQNPFAR